MSTYWILTLLIILIFSTFIAEIFRESADRDRNKWAKISINTLAKLIDYCIIGAIVTTLLKLYEI